MLKCTHSWFLFLMNVHSPELSVCLVFGRCVISTVQTDLEISPSPRAPALIIHHKRAWSTDPTCFPSSLGIFPLADTLCFISLSQFVIHFNGSSPKLFLTLKSPISLVGGYCSFETRTEIRRRFHSHLLSCWYFQRHFGGIR